MRRLISSGSPFEAAGGYSRAVVDGEWVFVSGTTGSSGPAGLRATSSTRSTVWFGPSSRSIVHSK